MNAELEAELRAWNREVSPLAAYAKTLRMEAPVVANSGPSQTEDQAAAIVDHFKDIDLDELPDNVRSAITNAKATLGTLQTTVTTAETRRTKAEEFARSKQSEADKLRGVVQRHNLDPNAAPKSTDLSDAKHLARVERLTKQGLKPEAAEIYATMFAEEAKATEAEILGRLGPMANAVGGLEATHALNAAEATHANLFAVPEIGKSVRDNVAVLVSQGQSVNDQTINHLLSMAYGSHLMAGNKPISEQKIPNLNGAGIGSGSHANNLSRQPSGAPNATQPETLSIVSAITKFMGEGLKKK